ncbi:MAG: aminotransferase class V-fold PLP-dependent enzyme [Spirochaetota bacterium]|nr:aminotransferase class V-fold PLP-dependent enzyme [Spirochaetota bacterium]
MGIIYLDNAATSWPKPEEVLNAMDNFSRNIGANPGRSGHRLSINAGRVIFETRESLAELLNIDDPLRIIFTKNATYALNIAIFGLLKAGDHAITSSMEHNSVMRPLREMERRGVELSVVECSPNGELDPQDIKSSIKNNTRAIYLTHASNVTGTIMPIAEVAQIAKEYDLIFCIDAAQTAGAIQIDVKDMMIDLLAFSGHKSFFGPQGTGGLFIGKDLEKEINTLEVGGTGSRSELEEQPDFLPDKYESGTPNTIGLAGLFAGVSYVLNIGIDKIRDLEMRLADKFIDGLISIPGVTLYGTKDASKQTSVVSFNIDGIDPSELAFEFDEKYNIMVRPGLHCAPSAHRTIGTYPKGTIRFSFGYFNTIEHVDFALEAIKKYTTMHK